MALFIQSCYTAQFDPPVLLYILKRINSRSLPVLQPGSHAYIPLF